MKRGAKPREVEFRVRGQAEQREGQRRAIEFIGLKFPLPGAQPPTLQGQTQPFLAFAQCVFRPLALGDVAGNFRSANNRAIAVSNRRDGHRNVNFCAILAHSHGLEMFHTLAPPDAGQNVGFLLGPFRRQQHHHRFADSLLGRVTENLLRATIPGGNDSIQRLADDGVIG